MEVLRDSLDQLITKTLKMEQNQVVQDPRLIKKEQEEEEIDWTHPCMQTQPMPESEVEEMNTENRDGRKKPKHLS